MMIRRAALLSLSPELYMNVFNTCLEPGSLYNPHPAFLAPIYSNLCTVSSFLYSYPCVSVPKMTSVSPRLPFPVLPSFFKMLLALPSFFKVLLDSSGSIPLPQITNLSLGFIPLFLLPCHLFYPYGSTYQSNLKLSLFLYLCMPPSRLTAP